MARTTSPARRPAKAPPPPKAKAPARKAPAKPKAAGKAAPPRRPPARRGPPPKVLAGFDRKARTWTAESTAGRLLLVLSWGATWEHAAARAKVHPAQPRRWNSRGEALLVPTPDEVLDLDDLDAQGIDDESFACAVFAVESIAHRASPVLSALETISREGAKDWRAAALALRVLPEARPYRETTRQELTGEDGGAVALDVEFGIGQTVLDLADRIAREHGDP